jgi:exodeoxyribonuclease III
MSKRKNTSSGPSPVKKTKSEEQKSGTGVFSRSTISIVSWNLNGLRAWVKKPSVLDFCGKDEIDVLCFNETKLQDDHVRDAQKHFPQFPFQFWSCSQAKKGYSGTAILSKVAPIRFTEGIGISKHDDEGRTITAEFDSFFVVSTYIPNAGQKLERLKYRTQEWDRDFRNYLKSLESQGKGVVWLGDLNVIHRDIDIYNIKGKDKQAGCTKEERKEFSVSLDDGLVDSFRHLYPNTRKFSWFSTKNPKAKSENMGWRLDYAVISNSLVSRLTDSKIYDDVDGSDHHPIEVILSN